MCLCVCEVGVLLLSLMWRTGLGPGCIGFRPVSVINWPTDLLFNQLNRQSFCFGFKKMIDEKEKRDCFWQIDICPA